MENVLRSSLDAILLAIQAQIIAVTGWDQSRVVIDTETEEPEGQWQAEQLVFIRLGSQTPQRDFEGMGRIWAAMDVRLNCILWTRTALDEPPGYAIGITDPILGHQAAALAIKNSLDAFQPLDSAGNWMVQEPMRPGAIGATVRRTKEDWNWAKTSIGFDLIYAPATDQSYQ